MDMSTPLSAVLSTSSAAPASAQTPPPHTQQCAPSSAAQPHRPAYHHAGRSDASTPPPNNCSGSNHRLRSSIACSRCRRSKTKCTNAGAGTTCESCAHSGRECVYPSLGSGLSKREPDGTDDLADRVKRPRVRRSDIEPHTLSADRGLREAFATGPMPHHQQRPVTYEEEQNPVRPEVQRAAETIAANTNAVLDPRLLTSTVCNEAFELFLLHYGAELPFIHPPTFQNALASAIHAWSAAPAGHDESRGIASAADAMSRDWEGLLLGILTLAARFHPTIAQYHAARAAGVGGAETAASEHYADALRTACFTCHGRAGLAPPTLPQVQALLMLALHEWSRNRTEEAYQYVGLAMRGAYTLGLHEVDKAASSWDVNDAAWRAMLPLRSANTAEQGHENTAENLQDPDSADAVIDEETHRRTFWSCFLLDQYLSVGGRRPPAISARTLGCQLPCGERAWVFGLRTCTRCLDGSVSDIRGLLRVKRSLHQHRKGAEIRNEDDMHATVMDELGQDEPLLSRVIRAAEIWGWVAQWSCSGGFSQRTQESTFEQLLGHTRHFENTMPRALRLTKANIQAHLAQRTSTPFVLLHTLHTLSVIVLHRSGLPFLPLHCLTAHRPSSKHRSLEQRPPLAPESWTGASHGLLEAARGMAELVAACQPRKMLPETPVVAFALYLVALLGVYMLHFPYMESEDQAHRSSQAIAKSQDVHSASKALSALMVMRDRLPMANQWALTVHRVHRYYEQAAARSPGETAHKPYQSESDSSAAPVTNGISAHLPLRDIMSPSENVSATGRGSLEQTLRALSALEAPAVLGDRAPDHYAASSCEHRSRPSLASSAGSDSRTSATPTTRPVESWTAVNSVVKTESPTAHAPLPRTPESAHQHLLDARQPIGYSSGPRPSAAASLPPLYQLAAAAVEDSQQSQPRPLAHAQLRALGHAHALDAADAVLRMTFMGDDVVAFIEGRRLAEGAIPRGAGWRSGGWLGEIWSRPAGEVT